MLKIVVFDGGFGGELFADRLESELPVVEVLRVIDWRHAEQLNKSPFRSRRLIEEALRPYIGRVDLIILANHILTLAHLKYFRRKYKNQKFSGLSLPHPEKSVEEALVLTTNATAYTLGFQHFLYNLKRPTTIIYLDDWLPLIDDGEMTNSVIRYEFKDLFTPDRPIPHSIILACAHFSDLKPNFRKIYGARKIKLYDGFEDSIYEVYKILNLRGTGKRRKLAKSR